MNCYRGLAAVIALFAVTTTMLQGRLWAGIGVASSRANAPAKSAGMPESPRVRVDTGYATTPDSRIVRVRAGDNLQAKVDAAHPGDVLLLDAGAVFVGNFVLRGKSGDAYITIRTSTADSALPLGKRVSPEQATLMAKIISPNSVPAIRTELGAHHYRLIGLEITKVHDQSPSTRGYEDVSYGLVWFGGPNDAGVYPTSVSHFPHHLIVDRCYIHGDYGQPHGQTYRGVMMNAAYVGIVNSYISNIHADPIEVQGLECFNGNGPIKIVNNYVEAAGENIMFGGADPPMSASVPSDIEIRHNYLSKPATWDPYDPSFAGVRYSVKNLLELKRAQRVLIDGNVLENNWVGAQDGRAILFTPRNQSGTDPTSTVRDVAFSNNIVRHVASVFNIIGADYNHPSEQTQRILIRNNLFYDIGSQRMGNTDESRGRFAAIAGGKAMGSSKQYPILDLVFDHNTAFITQNIMEMAGAPAAEHLVFRDNLVTHGAYGFFGDATGVGKVAIAKYAPGATFAKNVLIAATHAYDSYYPDGFVFVDIDKVGFADYAGGDYRLCVDQKEPIPKCARRSKYHNAGSDGRDIGVDMIELNRDTACVAAGTCGAD